MKCITDPEDDPQDAKELNPPSSASVLTMSPTGDRALAQINNDIYVVTIPQSGKANNISVASAESAEFPARKLTEIGGEFPYWQSNGKVVHWSLGSAHFTYDVDKAQVFEDSLSDAKKAKEQREADSKPIWLRRRWPDQIAQESFWPARIRHQQTLLLRL